MGTEFGEDDRDRDVAPGGGAFDESMYDRLRGLAEQAFRRQPAGHTLQPTALVHEAYLKLADAGGFNDREHFQATAARAMRQILVDRARRVGAQRHGGGRARVTIDEGLVAANEEDVDLLALDDALERLTALSARRARVVELRFFGGLDLEKTAEALGIARSTAAEDWRFARAWLARELGSGDDA